MLSTAQEKLLTAREVGDMVSLSKRQIFRLRAARLICPPIRVGYGAIRWRQSDIEKWISMDCCDQEQFAARTKVRQ
jgi:predicted DNA-binding transcriptional regulator AlpA